MAICLLTLPAPLYAKEPVRVIEGTVTKVSDGDTIQVTDSLGTKVKVRMYGIDAPETAKGNKKSGRISKPGQPCGEEAYQALKKKLSMQLVQIDVMAIDRYKRMVSIVRMGQRNINKEMVQEGWAWAYRSYLDRTHASEYIGLEEEARKTGRGLWQEANPLPPWEFRKAQRHKNTADY